MPTDRLLFKTNIHTFKPNHNSNLQLNFSVPSFSCLHRMRSVQIVNNLNVTALKAGASCVARRSLVNCHGAWTRPSSKWMATLSTFNSPPPSRKPRKVASTCIIYEAAVNQLQLTAPAYEQQTIHTCIEQGPGRTTGWQKQLL